MSEVKVYPPIILKPEDSFGKLLEKLYAEGWGVNSAEYMQADTLEEAVKLQAKSFPCLEFQPVQLSKPDNQYSYHHEGKWVAFHRTPKPKTPDSYGDWLVYYNSTEKYWFLRNEKTLQDHPKHFDHSPTLEEIKEALGEKEPQHDLPCGTEECEKCPDPCNDEERCGFGVRKSDACEDDACQECESRILLGGEIICSYFTEVEAIQEEAKPQPKQQNLQAFF